MTERRGPDRFPDKETPAVVSGGDLVSEDVELFLLKLRYKLGRLVHAPGYRPIPLDDAQIAWVVYAGRLDVFTVPVENGRVAGVRRHLLRAEAGHAVFGVGGEGEERQIALIAVGGPDTRLVRVQRSHLERLTQEEDAAFVAAMLERWVFALSVALSSDLPPKESVQLEPGELALEGGCPARAGRGVIWVKHVAGRSHLMGVLTLGLPQDSYPLAGPVWLRPEGEVQLQVVGTRAFLEQDPAWSGLDRFHCLVREAVALRVAQTEQTEEEHWRERAEADRSQMQSALARLATVMEPAAPTSFLDVEMDEEHALLSACRLVGRAQGLTIQSPPGGRRSADPLGDIARASRIRVRQVVLRDEWWRADSGPLLAYRQDGRPVALLPRRAGPWPWSGRYELVDSLTGERTQVTPEVAAALVPLAHILYPPLPTRALTALDLFRLGFRGGVTDLLTVVLAGFGLGVLSLVVPLVTGVLFNTVIPGAERGQLGQLGLVLLGCALAAALFLLVQKVTVLRLEGKWDGSVLSAIWDRLLRLPASFFRRYSSGDLAERAMGLDIIRRTLSGAAISSILVGLSSLFSLGLLFYYDSGLAWVAVGLALLSVAATLVAWRLAVRHQRQIAHHQGRIAGMVLEFTTAIAKLRVAGAERRAFARWARAFSAQRDAAFEARDVANGLAVFNTVFPLATTLLLFAMVAWGNGQADRLSTGDFLAFNAAFGQFLLASLAVSETLLSTLHVIPLYERVQPILQARPEVDPLRSDPGELNGEIEISHVAFQYQNEEPLVLKDVSLHVRPGEFLALVGPSGCGKSTLVRLLLGFERPLAGAIYYDGQDLLGLDVEQVRRQIGVVLQNSQLITGTILSNIVGSLSLSVDDAWEAARLVGLDEDIAEMPQGMHTRVSEGGSTLSGGQRQRLLIARAVVSRPRILFFDEATSALDNRSQALVGESLERLQATRIVVAHRLSTIAHADCIFVIDDGRVVQSGKYMELAQQKGLFAELTRRQVV
jgi:NHLM bacteriocin system ABC transporter ATP-binding protein